MKVKSTLVLGGVNYQFEIEDKDELETLHKIVILSNPRKVCPMCDNKDTSKMYFTTNKNKEGNTYINVKCVCGARSKLGRYKTGGYFWHEFERMADKLRPVELPTINKTIAKKEDDEIPELTDDDFPF